MSVRNYGNTPQFSTQTIFSTLSTATLIAEVQLSTVYANAENYEVRWIVGCSTALTWRLEHATSSGLGSSAITTVVHVYTGSNQSAEYVTTHRANPGDRFRVVPYSSGITANAAGKIQVETLT